MTTDRRKFVQTLGAAAATVTARAILGSAATSVQTRPNFKVIKGLAFDAYGTLFDVYSVTALCDRLFPGSGDKLAQQWRAKQLQYSMLRTLMGRYRDFWQLTEDGLVYAAKSLRLELTSDKRQQLMDAYLHLTAFPDVKPGLEALKKAGLKLAVLSNGEPKMLAAVAKSAGVDTILDAIISVDEIKAFKPDPRVYRLASTHLKLDPAALGFVSSNNWDVSGAASTGLTTFWIQRSDGEPPEELGHAADGLVKAITDLPALLRS